MSLIHLDLCVTHLYHFFSFFLSFFSATVVYLFLFYFSKYSKHEYAYMKTYKHFDNQLNTNDKHYTQIR